MTRRAITVGIYVGQCWAITVHYLKIISNHKHRGEIDAEYDSYAMPIIRFFRETEKIIIKTNKFDKEAKLKYDQDIKKIIDGVKNKYNDKKILWVSSTSSPVKKPHLK